MRRDHGRRNRYRRLLLGIGAAGLFAWVISLFGAWNDFAVVAFGSAAEQIRDLRVGVLLRHAAWLAAGGALWAVAWRFGGRRSSGGRLHSRGRRPVAGGRQGRSFPAGTESL